MPLLARHDTSIDDANYLKDIILGISVPSFVIKIRKANYFRVQMYSKIIDNCTYVPKYIDCTNIVNINCVTNGY